MTTALRTADSLFAHAVCAAAGARDGLRAAQFYARDLSNVDGAAGPGQRNVPFLSSAVARLARLADRFMTWSTNTAISVLLPDWRRLPSPFTPGIMDEVAEAIRRNSLVQNPLFNAYFFRAALHVVKRYAEPPYLVLEHRVDASRRQLAASYASAPVESETDFLARALVALVDTAPVARIGRSRAMPDEFKDIDPNVAVFAIACVSLLFAEQGKPIQTMDEDELFAIVGALILPRLKDISAPIAERDEMALSKALAGIKELY